MTKPITEQSDEKDELLALLSENGETLVNFGVLRGYGQDISADDIRTQIKSALMQAKMGLATVSDRVPVESRTPIDVRTLVSRSTTTAAA